MSQDSGCRPGMALIPGYGTATDICCISCLVHSPHSRHLDTHGDPRLTLTRAFAMSYSQQHAVRSSTVLRGFDSAGAKCHRMRSLQKISEMNLSSPIEERYLVASITRPRATYRAARFSCLMKHGSRRMLPSSAHSRRHEEHA